MFLVVSILTAVQENKKWEPYYCCRTARNPHALDRYTGGSSSGPAAIVASGLCSAALGTDGGGYTKVINFFFFIRC